MAKITKQPIYEIKRSRLDAEKKIQDRALPLRQPPTSLTQQSITSSTGNSNTTSDKGDKKDK
jgi:hypothetical protein